MTILIVDNCPLFRQGLISALAEKGEEQRVVEAGQSETAMGVIQKEKVDLVISDLRIGREDGLELLKKSKKQNPNLKYIIFSGSSRRDDILKTKQLGADGYIQKDTKVEDIVYGIDVVSRGSCYYSPGVMEKLLVALPQEFRRLTLRERQVLDLLRTGLTNAEIASQLFISEGTTKKHISSILGKLNVSNRIEAIIYANKLYS